MTTVSAPRIEHHREPLGIGESRPRLSWTLSNAPADWKQQSYAVTVVHAEGDETVEVASAEQVLVPWPSRALNSRERVAVRVSVQGADGGWSDPSPETWLETGLLHPEDWSARPVGLELDENPESDARRATLVRRGFRVDGEIARARLYATAHGLYDAEINGIRVGSDTLSPGWTVYRERLRYYTYDVTDLLRNGENALGAWLGDGWYRGRLGWRGGRRNIFGGDLSFLGQLEITYTDGTRQTLSTDDAWKGAPSPVLRSGIYDGEDHDARQEVPAWSTAAFDDGGWMPVTVRDRDPRTLVAPTGPPVRVTEDVAPLAVLTSPSGARILDFGQNLVGRVRIRVTGPRGSTVTLRTSEVLQEGEIYTRPLRSARSTDHYTLAGRPDGEEWEPRFTFHGFRYVEIDGWPGDLDADAAAGALTARVLHTDLERTGWFACSDPLVEQLHRNVVWGMRGNFLDIPTDCPQRDERVGWTGDIQVFGPTASTLFDVSGMLSGWLRDVEADQLPDGTVPWFVPVVPTHKVWDPIRPGAAWGDVATLLPWTLHQRFGDVGVLAAQFESARRWVDKVESTAGPDRLWNEGFQLGDWLDPAAPPQDPGAGRTDRYLVATAYFARSARAVADMARVLDRSADADRYAALAAEVAAAFRAAYVKPDGTMTSDAQTAYALAIAFDLLPDPAQRAKAGDRLADLVHADGNRIATGFVGTPLVCDALTLTGHVDTAYDLLLEKDCPSWLYQVVHGATTIWERWDALLPNGTVNPGSMTSFNHYALGAVADWLHRSVAGLAPADPGYRRIRFAPRPGGGLTHASATQRTPYGEASISWRIAQDELQVDLVVPVGATAELDLPGQDTEKLGHGAHTRSVPLSG